MEYFIISFDFLKSKGSKDLLEVQLPQNLLIFTPPKTQRAKSSPGSSQKRSFKSTLPSAQRSCHHLLPCHSMFRAGSNTQIDAKPSQSVSNAIPSIPDPHSRPRHSEHMFWVEFFIQWFTEQTPSPYGNQRASDSKTQHF